MCAYVLTDRSTIFREIWYRVYFIKMDNPVFCSLSTQTPFPRTFSFDFIFFSLFLAPMGGPNSAGPYLHLSPNPMWGSYPAGLYPKPFS